MPCTVGVDRSTGLLMRRRAMRLRQMWTDVMGDRGGGEEGGEDGSKF